MSMSDPVYDNTFWTPLRPDLDADAILWADGTAFYYPDEEGEALDGSLKAKPFTLAAFNQIISVRNDAVTDSITEGEADTVGDKDGEVPFLTTDIQDLKETIAEVQHDFEWHIPLGDEDYWHHDDITDLRRLSAYPDTLYDQEPTDFPLLAYWCFGYFSEGLRVLKNEWSAIDGSGGGSTYEGYTAYIGTVIAPANQTHRFWVWTGKLILGHHKGSTAGIIYPDGTMGPVIAAWPGNDGWYEGEVATDLGYVDWSLLQYVQDVEPDVNALETAVHPLKGYIYWEAYESYSMRQYTVTIDGIDTTVDWVYTTWTSCDDVTRTSSGTYQCGDGPPCFPCPGMGTSCTLTSTQSSDEEEEYIETGGTFFHTWEYYMDNFGPE